MILRGGTYAHCSALVLPCTSAGTLICFRFLASASSRECLSRYGLEKRLRERFARAWRAHDPLHAAPAHLFEDHAGYQWRVYTLAPEALRDFEARFDYHTQQQEAAHLQRLAESHFHSKAKTKHLRHALALHLCEESRLGHAVNEWNTVVPLPAMLVGRALSDYMDKCDRTVADFVADVLQRGDAAPKPSVGGGGRATVRQQLLAVLATNQGHLERLQPPRIHPVLEIMRAVLRARHPWIESGNILKVASCKNALRTFGSPEQLQLYCLAAKALYFAGFGFAGMGTNSHGTPVIWFRKRPLEVGSGSYAISVNILTALGLGVGEYVGANLDAERPSTAPAADMPPQPEDMAAFLAKLQGLIQRQNAAE